MNTKLKFVLYLVKNVIMYLILPMKYGAFTVKYISNFSLENHFRVYQKRQYGLECFRVRIN
jgi:hypothetical protein